MKLAIKLLFLTLILTTKNASVFSMDYLTEEELLDWEIRRSLNDSAQEAASSSSSSSSPSSSFLSKAINTDDSENKIDYEIKRLNEIPEEIITSKLSKINAYRDKCLKKYFPNVLSRLIQDYDPIEDKWKCERTIDSFGVVHALSLLADVKSLVTFSPTKSMIVFDLKTGQPTNKIFLTEETIRKLSVLSDGRLATADSTGIKIWNPLSAQYEKTISADENSVGALCALQENKLASTDRATIKIWNNIHPSCLSTSICEKEISDFDSPIRALCKLQKNKLVSGHLDKTIRIWDLVYGNCENIIRMDRTNSHITLLCELQNDKLVSVHLDNTIKIWNLKTNECEFTGKNANDLRISSICSLPEKKFAAAYCGTIMVWSHQVDSLNIPEEHFDLNEALNDALDQFDEK